MAPPLLDVVVVVFVVLGCMDVDVVGALKGRMNVIELDFGLDFGRNTVIIDGVLLFRMFNYRK